MKLFYFLFFTSIFFSLQVEAQQTIQSVPQGGEWNAGSTWVGGNVPRNTDFVVINGPVSLIGNISCMGLTLTAGGVLMNGNSTTVLTVNGNVRNEGAIRNNQSGWRFNLQISGSLTNNGVWETTETQLIGLAMQEISCGAQKYLAPSQFISVANPQVNIRAVGSLYLKSPFILNGAVINLQKNALFLHGNGRFQNGSLQNTESLYFEQNAHLGAYGHNLTVKGDSIRIRNRGRVGDIQMEGNLIVVDTLMNIEQTTTVNLKGAILNRGVI
jgi:hypothetical protein